MIPRPFFQETSTAVVVGLVLFGAGSWCLYDAWERRGGRTPRLMRPFAWW